MGGSRGGVIGGDGGNCGAKDHPEGVAVQLCRDLPRKSAVVFGRTFMALQSKRHPEVALAGAVVRD